MGDYFIRVDDATDLRRKILESSKASVHILRTYHKLERTRGAKLTLIKSLKRELKDLTLLINRLEEITPNLTKTELQELNPELPALERGKKRNSKKSSSRKKSGKKAARKKAKKPEESKEKGVYLGPPERKMPVEKPPEQQPKEQPRSKEDLLHEKLSDIERKLKSL